MVAGAPTIACMGGAAPQLETMGHAEKHKGSADTALLLHFL